MRAAFAKIILWTLAATILHADSLEIKWSDATRKYCHQVLFPSGFPIPIFGPDGHSQIHAFSAYEFRVEGPLSTTFLVGAEIGNYTPSRYAPWKYRVDLADPEAKPVPVPEEVWKSGTKIAFYQRNIVDNYLDRDGKATGTASDRWEGIPYLVGKRFQKRGEDWAGGSALLSTDAKRLVLESSTGPVTLDRSLKENYWRPKDRGDIFLDVYETEAGKKLLGVDGTYDGNAIHWLHYSGWVTDRFFVLALKEYFGEALVCDFGSSPGGEAFARTTFAELEELRQPQAVFTSFSDSQDASGLTVAAHLDIATPGKYVFYTRLRASNGKVIYMADSKVLSPGAQQIAVHFLNRHIYDYLGVDGPYERVSAELRFKNTLGSKNVIAEPAGTTAAYTVASFAPPLIFTNQNTVAGVITGAEPTYDLLRVTIGINNSIAADVYCSTTGELTDSTGKEITSSHSLARIPLGAQSVVLDFNGNVISRSTDGPYRVRGVKVYCSGQEFATRELIETSALKASQFTFAAADFSLAQTSATPAKQGGATSRFSFRSTFLGGFAGDLDLAVTGLPTGTSATLQPTKLVGGGWGFLDVTTDVTAPIGSHPLTITATSGTIIHTLIVNLEVLAPR